MTSNFPAYVHITGSNPPIGNYTAPIANHTLCKDAPSRPAGTSSSTISINRMVKDTVSSGNWLTGRSWNRCHIASSNSEKLATSPNTARFRSSIPAQVSVESHTIFPEMGHSMAGLHYQRISSSQQPAYVYKRPKI